MRAKCPKCACEFEIAKPAKPKKDAPSERAEAFATWFRTLIPATVAVPAHWQAAWARIYDDMIRLDQRTPEQIAAVCRAGRADPFWSKQFFTPKKLRQRNNGGAQYFDVFAALSSAARPASRAAVEDGRHCAEPTRPLRRL